MERMTRRSLITTSAAAASLVPLAAGEPAWAAPTSPGVGDPGTVLKVSDLGHDLTDSTQYLQAALDSDAATVVIDHVPGGWTTRPLFIRRSNLTVIIEPDVMVRALPGGFTQATDSLLTVRDQHTIRLSGYGATFAMNKPEYTTGEWRMATRFYGCSDVVVEGLVLRDSGGDGVYIGSGAQGPSRDFVLRDVVADNHRRQGLSVISVENLLVDGCAFLNTVGTPPQSGIDFEPNAPEERIVNAVVRECVFQGNMTAGIQVYGGYLLPTSHPLSITIERSSIGHQIGGSPHVMISAKKDVSFPGTIEIQDCLIDTGSGSSGIGVFRTTPSGVQTKVRRTGIWSWATAALVYPTLLVYARGVAEFGNLSLSDVVVQTDQPGPVLATDRLADSRVHNVVGDLTAVGPATELPDLGEGSVDCDLTTTLVRTPEMPTVSVRSVSGMLQGGDSGGFVFTRSGDLGRSLAVAYATSGSARERYDYGGLGKVVVFPRGAREVRLNVRTFARRRTDEPTRRELLVSVAQGRGYLPQPVSARLQIQD